MNARLPVSMAAALVAPLVANSVVAECVASPFVITVEYATAAGTSERRIEIVQATLQDAPDGESFVPEGCVFLRADVFPATRFEDMRPATRERYRMQYRTFLLWRKAQAKGKAVADMLGWIDYDAIELEEDSLRWARGGQYWAGD